jgi:hypothetical protein
VRTEADLIQWRTPALQEPLPETLRYAGWHGSHALRLTQHRATSVNPRVFEVYVLYKRSGISTTLPLAMRWYASAACDSGYRAAMHGGAMAPDANSGGS